MRTINLIMHQQSLHHLSELSDSVCNMYGKHESNSDTKITKVKEEQDLLIFIDALIAHMSSENQLELSDGYFWNYAIPRIGKEFDLLRIGKNTIINIELKSIASEKKMEAQLIANRKYLKIMGKQVYSFSFRTSDRMLFTYDEDRLQTCSFDVLVDLLKRQEVDAIQDINELFSPSKFLISPFNNTEQFILDEYFLTTQQEKIYRDIVKFAVPCHAIIGSVGTGKSLLLYHIAKSLWIEKLNGKSVTLLHCGMLNDGHTMLKEHGYTIYSVGDWMNAYRDIHTDILCIDEFQRLSMEQIHSIMTYVTENKMKLIVSIDPVQIMDATIKQESSFLEYTEKYEMRTYKLSNHIRSNPDISRFCKDVMNLKKHHGKIPSDHIRIFGVKNIKQANDMITFFEEKGYCNIDYLHHTMEIKPDIHHMIGQEYDSVVTTLDDTFFYNEKQMLDAYYENTTQYLRPEMFYEAITRDRKDLVIIVINHPELFTTILKLFR